VIHRREELGPRVFRWQLTAARDEVLRQATCAVPPTAHSRNMAKRFERHGEAYFEFVTTPGVEPTNNLAEQAIRFVVIDRHLTQGTGGERPALVRADLDRGGDLRSAGPLGIRVPVRCGGGILSAGGGLPMPVPWWQLARARSCTSTPIRSSS
jgi:hypothetical protein